MMNFPLTSSAPPQYLTAVPITVDAFNSAYLALAPFHQTKALVYRWSVSIMVLHTFSAHRQLQFDRVQRAKQPCGIHLQRDL